MIISYSHNQSTTDQIISHFNSCDQSFVNSIKARTEIVKYSEKLCLKSQRIEAWNKDILVGLLAFYTNKEFNFIYISNISVIASFYRKGIGKILLGKCIDFCKKNKVKQIKLEVYCQNYNALKFYKKMNFLKMNEEDDYITMNYLID